MEHGLDHDVEHGLDHEGAKSEEHDHDTLEISFGVPGINVTFESKEVIEVTW